MSNFYQRWRKQRVAINNSEWTPIAPVDHMDYVALRCDDSAIVYRTDLLDSATEDTLGQGVQDGVIGATTGPHGIWNNLNSSRFLANVPIVWVKSVASEATLIVTWVL